MTNILDRLTGAMSAAASTVRNAELPPAGHAMPAAPAGLGPSSPRPRP